MPDNKLVILGALALVIAIIAYVLLAPRSTEAPAPTPPATTEPAPAPTPPGN